MKVETFECSETAAEPIEACEEAIRIATELGMEGQIELTQTDENGIQSRCPYREMTRDELFMYQVLCPEKSSPEAYKRSAIPLRVLQVLAHAQTIELFKRFEIWDKESQVVKDPVLVAFDKRETYASSRKTYILARWGEELETPSTLLKRAIEFHRAHLLDQAKKLVSQAKSVLGDVEHASDSQVLQAGADASFYLRTPNGFDD